MTRMETRVMEVDPLEDCRSVYNEAAGVLAEGGLVAIPTETVYGLGADALNTEAVANVFAVKARPSFDPLICHFARAKDIKAPLRIRKRPFLQLSPFFFRQSL